MIRQPSGSDGVCGVPWTVHVHSETQGFLLLTSAIRPSTGLEAVPSVQTRRNASACA